MAIRGIAWDFEGAGTWGRKVVAPKAVQPTGSGDMLPHKILKFIVSEMPFPAFSTEHFEPRKI